VAYALAPQLDLVVFALIGLFGGAHCLGMCGPLVTTYTDRFADDGSVDFYEVRQQLLFNLGRVAGYAAAGAVFGLLGALVFDAAAVAEAANGVRAVVGVVAGALIVAAGVSYLRGGAGGPLARLEGSGRAARLLTRHVDRLVRGPGIALLGGAHALLPCPLIYPAYLYALSRGDPLEGAVALGVLGLGTVPSLFGYGTALGALPVRWLRRVHRGLGAAFVLLGYLPLSHGLVLLGVPVPMPPVHDLLYQPLEALVGAAQYCLP